MPSCHVFPLSQMCSRGHRAVFGFSLGLWLCLARHPASSPLGGSEVAGRAVLEGEGVSAWQGLLWVPGGELLLLQRCLWDSGVSARWLLIKCLG